MDCGEFSRGDGCEGGGEMSGLIVDNFAGGGGAMARGVEVAG